MIKYGIINVVEYIDRRCCNWHVLISILEKIGLTERQARIYLACLELGECTIKDISLKSGIKRTSIYDIMGGVVDLGVVRQVVLGKKKRYLAIDPEELRSLIKKREFLLDQILPDLRYLDNAAGSKPKVWFFNEVEGLKKAYEDLLNYENATVYGWASEDLVKFLGDDWVEFYVRKRVRQNIREHMIYPLGEISKKYLEKDEEHLRESKIIDGNKYKFGIEINIYNNRISMVSVKDKAAVIIESKPIVDTFKTIFQICWDSLK